MIVIYMFNDCLTFLLFFFHFIAKFFGIEFGYNILSEYLTIFFCFENMPFCFVYCRNKLSSSLFKTFKLINAINLTSNDTFILDVVQYT